MSWDCPRCTLKNGPSLVRCSVCGGNRPRPPPPRGPPSRAAVDAQRAGLLAAANARPPKKQKGKNVVPARQEARKKSSRNWRLNYTSPEDEELGIRLAALDRALAERRERGDIEEEQREGFVVPSAVRKALAELEGHNQSVRRARPTSTSVAMGSPAEIAILSTMNQRLMAIDVDGAGRVFDLIDSDKDGQISFAELSEGIRLEVVREYIHATKNYTLKSLLKPERQGSVFRKIDESCSGFITRAAWCKFVRSIARERIRFIKTKGLRSGRCYWGHGLEEVGVKKKKKRPPLEGCFRLFGYPRGFAADFWFYAQNNHPLLAWFDRDPAHPILRREAVCCELILQSYNMVMSLKIASRELDWFTWYGFAWNVAVTSVYITIPMLVISEILFNLLACPCVHYERRGRKKEVVLGCCKLITECLGLLVLLPLTLAAIVLVGYAVYQLTKNFSRLYAFALNFGLALVCGYLYWPVLKLLVQFNLFFGNTCCCCRILQILGFGRWAAERRQTAERFLNRLSSDEDDDDEELIQSFEFVLQQTTAQQQSQRPPRINRPPTRMAHIAESGNNNV